MTLRIDARGMRCPWPAIRLARALRDGAPRIELMADDPAAPAEIGAVVDQFGCTFEARSIDSVLIFYVAAPVVNGSFTRDD